MKMVGKKLEKKRKLENRRPTIINIRFISPEFGYKIFSCRRILVSLDKNGSFLNEHVIKKRKNNWLHKLML